MSEFTTDKLVITANQYTNTTIDADQGLILAKFENPDGSNGIIGFRGSRYDGEKEYGGEFYCQADRNGVKTLMRISFQTDAMNPNEDVMSISNERVQGDSSYMSRVAYIKNKMVHTGVNVFQGTCYNQLLLVADQTTEIDCELSDVISVIIPEECEFSTISILPINDGEELHYKKEIFIINKSTKVKSINLLYFGEKKGTKTFNLALNYLNKIDYVKIHTGNSTYKSYYKINEF